MGRTKSKGRKKSKGQKTDLRGLTMPKMVTSLRTMGWDLVDAVKVLPFDEVREEHPHFPTGSDALDELIGGPLNRHHIRACPGIPVGKITHIYDYGVRFEERFAQKVALMIARTAVKAGKRVCWIDFFNESIEDLGTSDLAGAPRSFHFVSYPQVANVDEGFNAVVNAIREGCDLVIWNGVGMEPVEDAGVCDSTRGVNRARWTSFMTVFKLMLQQQSSTFIGLSKASEPGSLYPSGGRAWKSAPAVEIELREHPLTRCPPVQFVEDPAAVGMDPDDLHDLRNEALFDAASVRATLSKCSVSGAAHRHRFLFIGSGGVVGDAPYDWEHDAMTDVAEHDAMTGEILADILDLDEPPQKGGR